MESQYFPRICENSNHNSDEGWQIPLQINNEAPLNSPNEMIWHWNHQVQGTPGHRKISVGISFPMTISNFLSFSTRILTHKSICSERWWNLDKTRLVSILIQYPSMPLNLIFFILQDFGYIFWIQTFKITVLYSTRVSNSVRFFSFLRFDLSSFSETPRNEITLLVFWVGLQFSSFFPYSFFDPDFKVKLVFFKFTNNFGWFFVFLLFLLLIFRRNKSFDLKIIFLKVKENIYVSRGIFQHHILNLHSEFNFRIWIYDKAIYFWSNYAHA